MNNRVFLLNPPTKEYATSFPLGLAYLSAILRKHGYEVKVIDAQAPYNLKTAEQIKNAARDFRPLFIGVSLQFDFITEKYKLVRELKELGYPVVCGGPHVNILAREVIENGCDIVSIGEGEEAILELAEAFNSGRNLEEIQGLGLRKDNGDIVFAPKRREIENLDEIPLPDYSDFKVADYMGTDDLSKVDKTFFDVFTSRGCMYRCTYCLASRVWGGRQRIRSARNVFEEINYLVKHYRAHHIAFMDTEPLVNKQRIYELCDLLERNKIKIKISTRARIDNIDGDLIKRMKEVGFYKLAIGVESGDDETLRRVNRFYTQKDILMAIESLDRIKFPIIHFNNIIGFPWETTRHFKSSLELSLKIPKSLTYYVNVVTPIPLPGTPLYSNYCEEYGFKDWWLDINKQELLHGKNKEIYFYKLFMPRLFLEYWTLNFWHYPSTVKKEILNFQLKIQKIAYGKNRFFRFLEIAVIFFLIKLSVNVYLISPKLEKTIFFFTGNRAVMNYAKKFVFQEQ